MQTIARDDATVYEFGRDLDPILTVEPGESFRIETWDALEGALFGHGEGPYTPEDVPALTSGPPGIDANPVGGPVYVEGAEPGDTLAVEIEEITPERGVTTTFWGFGSLSGRSGWEECDENYAYEVELDPGPGDAPHEGRARVTMNGHEWSWGLNPHVGTIATAPARTVQDTVTSQGPWGGNMDVRDATVGSTVYLDAFAEGGLLFLGDVHASQSDSEYTGVAVEATAEVVVNVDVVDRSVPGVFRIEDEDSVIHVDSAKNAGTAMDAVNDCFVATMEELVADHGLGKREAYVQMSVNPGITVRVYQFVHPDFFTVGVKLDKDVLDGFA